MIRIYSGTDNVSSRKQFADYKQKFEQDAEYEVIEIKPQEFVTILSAAQHEQYLFAPKNIYFTENILSKKASRDIVMSLQDNHEVELVIWEDQVEARIIKQYLPKSQILISDVPSTIWKLLDGLRPGNKVKSIQTLNEIVTSVDEHLILFMIQRRVKELIMMYRGFTGGKKLADWQQAKLKSQLSTWDKDKLIMFYSKLYSIERSEKTGTTSYGIRQALEILFSFYL